MQNDDIFNDGGDAGDATDTKDDAEAELLLHRQL